MAKWQATRVLWGESVPMAPSDTDGGSNDVTGSVLVLHFQLSRLGASLRGASGYS